MDEPLSKELPADPHMWLGGQTFLTVPQANDESREMLAELIDTVLDEKERWIINALFWEGKSLQQVADDLGFSTGGKKNKTLVIYYRDKALRKMKEALCARESLQV